MAKRCSSPIKVSDDSLGRARDELKVGDYIVPMDIAGEPSILRISEDPRVVSKEWSDIQLLQYYFGEFLVNPRLVVIKMRGGLAHAIQTTKIDSEMIYELFNSRTVKGHINTLETASEKYQFLVSLKKFLDACMAFGAEQQRLVDLSKFGQGNVLFEGSKIWLVDTNRLFSLDSAIGKTIARNILDINEEIFGLNSLDEESILSKIKERFDIEDDQYSRKILKELMEGRLSIRRAHLRQMQQGMDQLRIKGELRYE
ncbi:hypothetical protein HOG48_01765 [Candidatus Peregrinibacteria bacterium]|jgi:hypothetical protein|nr:hypothetical protein [Candidatus Peregrinibacteria bacterium]